MADLVEGILLAEAEKQASYKPTDVQKDIDVDYDEGNLLIVDPNEIKIKQLRSKKEEYLRAVARDNTQLLITKIWDLPVERVEDAVVAKLPDVKTSLPREKPIPKKKPPTRWEQYARLKGIQNRKKGRKVWDDELKQWVPRWGYKSKNDEKRDWVLEVPQNADPFEDQFEKKKKEKQERVSKNELQRLRNIARNMKGKVPGVGLTPTEKPDKDYLAHSLTAAKKSDASLGRFSAKVQKEDRKMAKSGRKRKFESNTGDLSQEKKRALNVLKHLGTKVPVIDKAKAGNMLLHNEETTKSKTKAGTKRSKKGGKKGGKHKGKVQKAGKKTGKKRGKR